MFHPFSHYLSQLIHFSKQNLPSHSPRYLYVVTPVMTIFFEIFLRHLPLRRSLSLRFHHRFHSLIHLRSLSPALLFRCATLLPLVIPRTRSSSTTTISRALPTLIMVNRTWILAQTAAHTLLLLAPSISYSPLHERVRNVPSFTIQIVRLLYVLSFLYTSHFVLLTIQSNISSVRLARKLWYVLLFILISFFFLTPSSFPAKPAHKRRRQGTISTNVPVHSSSVKTPSAASSSIHPSLSTFPPPSLGVKSKSNLLAAAAQQNVYNIRSASAKHIRSASAKPKHQPDPPSIAEESLPNPDDAPIFTD